MLRLYTEAMKLIHSIVISSICAWLIACGAVSADAVYRDYVERLARTLDVEMPAVELESIKAFPARRQLKLIEPEMKMGLLDFLKLQDCNLQQLIAQRNSSLGKVMPDSQRLIYEHKLMQSLQSCLQLDRQEPEYIVWMQKLLASKQAMRQIIFWNTVIASPEMAQFFSPSAPYFKVSDIEQRQDIQRALSQLLSWQSNLGGDRNLNADSLEQAYLSIAAEQYGGQLIQSAVLAKVWVDSGTLLIHSALEKRPLCPQGRATPQSTIMQNILNKFFVAKIQPHLARIQGELQALSQQFAIVEIQNGQEAYRQYYQRYLSKQGLPKQYAQSIKQHVQAWQRLLKQCGAMPTR